ncbi:unnamed protein product [Owenia fusiformis]|uniref:Uncharacterized protein n=1 Tax=Owenia fusiformis TaxID=6347 RepID=A0A8J1TD02_OWEFU|nr:unnamed protein product [Owenia fusiformis]
MKTKCELLPNNGVNAAICICLIFFWQGVCCGNECPKSVGYVSPLKDNHGNWINVLTDLKIPCPGYIIGWEHQRFTNSEPFWIAVLTPLGSMLYTVRHIVKVPVTHLGLNRLRSPNLKVEHGDVLSVIFANQTIEGGIANERNHTRSPVLKPEQYYRVLSNGRYFVDDTTVGDVLNMNPSELYIRGYALRPLLSYDNPSESISTATKVATDSTIVDHVINELTCRSKIECAMICLKDIRCLTYSYTKLTRMCVLHDIDDNDNSLIKSKPGTDLYSIML